MTDEALKHLAQADQLLGRLIEAVGPCRLKPAPRRSPFEALVKSVAYQQLNGTAAATIFGRFKAIYPGRRFPTPNAVLATSDERLRAAGLSRAKAAAIKSLAAHTISGVVPSSREIARMTDEEVLERLTAVRGVGPWTVHMLLIFTLGRTDVLPATDYGVRKGFALLYGWPKLPTPKELEAHGEKWRPHRSTAAWYFWRALELPPEDRKWRRAAAVATVRAKRKPAGASTGKR
jgi:3-methyladenine DNA glycosylase/8-oxoguanine DNA glycosylase